MAIILGKKIGLENIIGGGVILQFFLKPGNT